MGEWGAVIRGQRPGRRGEEGAALREDGGDGSDLLEPPAEVEGPLEVEARPQGGGEDPRPQQ